MADTPEIETDLVDVTDVPLSRLRTMRNPAVDQAARRLVDEIDDPQGNVGGHES
ncbi:hypothetical protein ACFPIJ_21660 [Dactylosporangium cerinum]|uniref:FXSXX-COOH protein n=1 Tax=Dactylosporangium cerinum TaxID=1434730 RepID=A0ABV9VVL0_9ACTN